MLSGNGDSIGFAFDESDKPPGCLPACWVIVLARPLRRTLDMKPNLGLLLEIHRLFGLEHTVLVGGFDGLFHDVPQPRF